MNSSNTRESKQNFSNPSPSNPEICLTDQKRIACDGGDGALGHPRVYLTVVKDGKIDCPYCDRRYILKNSPYAKEYL